MRIAVVGLGMAGASVAAYLAENGHDVIGLEQFHSPHTHGSSHGDNRMLRRIPGEGPEYVALMDWAYPMWQQLSQRFNKSFFVPCGVLEAIAPGVDWQNHGKEQMLLTNAEAQQKFPLFSFPVGSQIFYSAQSGYVLAEETILCFLTTAAQHGADLRMNTKAAAVSADGQSITLDTGEEIKVDYTVVCAGSWVKRLLPEIPVVVQRRVLAWYQYSQPLPLQPGFAVIGDEVVYGMPGLDGNSYKIGHHQHFMEEVSPDSSQQVNPRDETLLNSIVQRYLPGIKSAPYRTAVCKYTCTANDDFIIDFAPDMPRTLVVSACSGHGFKYAPAYGKLVEHMLSGKDIPFDASRFKYNARGVAHV